MRDKSISLISLTDTTHPNPGKDESYLSAEPPMNRTQRPPKRRRAA